MVGCYRTDRIYTTADFARMVEVVGLYRCDIDADGSKQFVSMIRNQVVQRSEFEL